MKLRLVIASVDTARQIGIDWWEHDPWLSSRARPPVEPGPRDPEEVEASRRPRVVRRAERAARVDRAAREEWDEYD